MTSLDTPARQVDLGGRHLAGTRAEFADTLAASRPAATEDGSRG